MRAAVEADSRWPTYALLGHDEFGFWAKANVAFGQGSRSFPPIPARQTRCAPLPLVGRGWGWGSLFGATSVRHRITPLPHKGGGSRPSVRQQHRDGLSRRPDEIDHRRLVRLRREADGGGAGGGERLRDLAGETKVHQRERALEHAGAGGAIEIGLRAAAGKMQDAFERALRQRHRNVRRKALDLDRAIDG